MLVTRPSDAILVRRGEDFLGRHIGNAVAAVVRGGAAAEPEVIVGEADAEIGAGPAEMQRRSSAFRSGGRRGRADWRRALSRRRRDRADRRARRRKWRPRGARALRPAADRGIRRRPRREWRRRTMRPIDLVAHDQFERGAVGFRVGAIHAAHLFRDPLSRAAQDRCRRSRGARRRCGMPAAMPS